MDEESSYQSGTKNAFSILMETAKIKTAVPDKKLESGNKKNQLKNDIIDFLVINKLGWDPAHATSIGCKFVNTVSDTLWYIDGNFSSLSSRGCAVPELFDVFQGYNKPELHKKRKRDESNLKATELTAYSNSLFTLAGKSYMKTNRWKDVNKAILDLANNLHKYATYLEQKNVKMQQHHVKYSCVGQVDEWNFLTGTEIAPGSNACYHILHVELENSEPYQPIFVNDHMP